MRNSFMLLLFSFAVLYIMGVALFRRRLISVLKNATLSTHALVSSGGYCDGLWREARRFRTCMRDFDGTPEPRGRASSHQSRRLIAVL